MISTRDLSDLPGIDDLKRLMQSMAMLDAILCPEWEYRYYSFNSKWGKGEQIGSMRNGQGDDLVALFTEVGCFLKGFAHESPMTPYAREPKSVWEGILDSVPDEFACGLNEPAFSMEDTTFCIWRKYTDKHWQIGKITFPETELHFDGKPIDSDGSTDMLSRYDGKPETYFTWAKNYFDLDKTGENLTLEDVWHVYAHKPLTTNFVRAISPALTLAKLKGDIDEIGYSQRKK